MPHQNSTSIQFPIFRAMVSIMLVVLLCSTSGCNDGSEILSPEPAPLSYSDFVTIPVAGLTFALDANSVAFLTWTAHASGYASNYIIRRQLTSASGFTLESVTELAPVRSTFDSNGRFDWLVSSATEFAELLTGVGIALYQVAAVFPDRSVSVFSQAVSQEIQQPGAIFIPDNAATSETLPETPNCSDWRQLILSNQAYCSYDFLIANADGDDNIWLTNDDVVTREIWNIKAGAQPILLPPNDMGAFAHLVRFANFGDDGLPGTSDDLAGSVIDRSEITAATECREIAYRFAQPKCVSPTTDIQYYREQIQSAGNRWQLKTFSGPGLDGEWLNTDDRASGHSDLYFNAGSVTQQSTYLLPGADTVWGNNDDVPGIDSYLLLDGSQRPATSITNLCIGCWSTSSRRKFFYNIQNQITASIDFAYDAATLLDIFAEPATMTPVSASFYNYVADRLETIYRVLPGTDLQFGSSDDVTTSVLRVIDIDCTP